MVHSGEESHGGTKWQWKWENVAFHYKQDENYANTHTNTFTVRERKPMILRPSTQQK